MKQKLFKYLITCVICFVGFLIKVLLIKTIHYPEGGFLLSLGSVMVSAWYGGFGTGILAVFINYIVLDWLFITPGKLLFNDSFLDQIRFAFFIVEGIFISYLFELLHRANHKINISLLSAKRSEKLARSVIENIKDYALFIIDSKGDIASWNEGATIMTGYERTEILNKSISIFIKNLNEKALKKILATAKAKGQYKLDVLATRKGGALFWVEIVITYLSDIYTSSQSFSVIFHDITAKKKIDDLKTEFISVVAHELRTPVTIMQLILENVQADLELKKIQEKNIHITDLVNEVQRFSMLIDNILDITRLKTKKFTLNIQPENLNSVISHIVRKMQLVAGKNHQIIFLPAKMTDISIDKLRIDQVLFNLIDNAIKYSPKKGKIIVSMSVVKKIAKVQVFNEAIDELPKNKRLLIFDKFYQLAKTPISGFGLGLYISKEIIKQHKGTMTVVSQEGKGTTFSFTLPLK